MTATKFENYSHVVADTTMLYALLSQLPICWFFAPPFSQIDYVIYTNVTAAKS